MTLGYRTDKIALLQIIDKEFFYLGMMGSANKMESLFAELKTEGIDERNIEKIFTPVGLNIYSKRPRDRREHRRRDHQGKEQGLSAGRAKGLTDPLVMLTQEASQRDHQGKEQGPLYRQGKISVRC